MTFAAFDQSNAQARPVSLVRLVWGNSQWAYCNADRAITHDSVTYLPVPLVESDLTFGGREIPEFTLTVPADLPVVAMFRGTPPSTRVKLLIRHLHPDDPDQESVIRWSGPITNVRPLDNARAELVSRISGLRRSGGRLTYGRGCKYALFGVGCGVAKAAYALPRTVTAVDGNLITLNAARPSEGWFTGGLLEWDADGFGTIESRTIEREMTATQVRLFGRGDGIAAGMAVTLYPGCARNPDPCQNKFNNLANYPGLDFMRGESPFDGRALL